MNDRKLIDVHVGLTNNEIEKRKEQAFRDLGIDPDFQYTKLY